MADPPALRASDAERERAVAALGAHAGDGRLTVEELDERTAAAYAARTLPELDALMADLPPLAASPPVPTGALDPVPEEAPVREDFRGHLATYLLVNVVLVVIWLATGAGHPWPVYPLLGWGLGVAFDYSETRRTVRRLRAAAPEERPAIVARHSDRSGCGGGHAPRHRHRHRLPAPPRP